MSDPGTDELAVGRRVAFRKTLSVAEQAMFTGISGNLGPLYVDRVRARAAGQADMLAFELVVASLATTGVARLAGPGWRIAGLTLDFSEPVPVGTTVEASAEVEAVEADQVRLRLTCRLASGAGEVADRAVMTGAAVLARV